MYKRMISALLALVLLLGNVPVTALAMEVPIVLEEGITETEVTTVPETAVTEQVAMGVTGDVSINETNFPDANFRSYIRKNIDSDGNGVLSKKEIAACKSMDVSENQITSLQGIEHFTALTELDCGFNQLTSLDISGCTVLKTLKCDFNQLTSLDLNSNTELDTLWCTGNRLTSLNVSKNTALTNLACGGNPLVMLDVSKNTSLKYLNCAESQLTSLDVSKNTALTYLYCWANQLTNLDVRSNTALTQLYCPGNQLTSLDVSNNTALTDFRCDSNQYTIAIADGKTFNLSSLPGNFDVSKASSWSGGTVKGTILTVTNDAKNITYTYDCGNGKRETFTLTVKRTTAPVLKVSNNVSSGKPVLTWGKVDGAVKYQIYRSKTGKAGSYGLINTVKTLTTTNNNAVAGTKYYYKVRAVFSDNTKSDYSNVVTITCDLATPTGVKITSNAATGKNVISWNKVEGAAKYQVWMSTTGKAGSFKVLMTTKSLTHTHGKAVAGTKYYYKVKAIHANSAANSALTGAFSRVCDLAAPSGVTVSATAAGKNKISWEAVEGAAKYQVWFSKTGKAGSFKSLMTTKNLNHTHKGGVAGQTYYYKVKAIHTNTNANSAYSAVVSRISR